MYNSENEMTLFYNNIFDSVNQNDSAEVLDVIKQEGETCGFYELCQRYVDVALNAEKFIDKETRNLMCCNKFSDIEIAAQHTKDFVEKYRIKDYDALLTMIKKRYVERVSQNDKREKSTFVTAKEYSTGSVGLLGQYVILTDIPSWNEVESDILKKLQG